MLCSHKIYSCFRETIIRLIYQREEKKTTKIVGFFSLTVYNEPIKSGKTSPSPNLPVGVPPSN